MVQNLREARVGTLGHASCFDGTGALFRIVVNLPVLSLDDLPVEVLVLNLVLAEVLLRVEASADEQYQEGQCYANRFHFLPTPVVPAPPFPHRSTDVLSDRTTEASDERCVLQNRRNRATPSGPAATLPCDAPSNPSFSSPLSRARRSILRVYRRFRWR